MYNKLAYMSVLSTGMMMFAADLPIWNRIDASSIAQTRSSLTEAVERESSVSTLNLLTEGLKQGSRHRYSFTLMNPSADSARMLLEFFDGAGNRMEVNSPQGLSQAEFITLPGGGETTLALQESAAPLGWVRATSDQAAGLRLQARWNLDDSQDISAFASASKLNVTFHAEVGTYLSLVNPSEDTDSTVRLNAFSANGDDLCDAKVELAPGSQLQGNLTRWLSCDNVSSVQIETVSGHITAAAFVLNEGRPSGSVPLYPNGNISLGSFQSLQTCSPTFSDDYTEIVPAGGKKISFFVRGSCSWSINNIPSDFVVSPRSGSGPQKITVTVPNLPSAGGRQVELKMGNSSIKVRQNGTACFYTLNTDKLEFKQGQTAKAFLVTSNCHWEISSVGYFYDVNETMGFQNKGAVVTLKTTAGPRTDYLNVADKKIFINKTF